MFHDAQAGKKQAFESHTLHEGGSKADAASPGLAQVEEASANTGQAHGCGQLPSASAEGNLAAGRLARIERLSAFNNVSAYALVSATNSGMTPINLHPRNDSALSVTATPLVHGSDSSGHVQSLSATTFVHNTASSTPPHSGLVVPKVTESLLNVGAVFDSGTTAFSSTIGITPLMDPDSNRITPKMNPDSIIGAPSMNPDSLDPASTGHAEIFGFYGPCRNFLHTSSPSTSTGHTEIFGVYEPCGDILHTSSSSASTGHAEIFYTPQALS